MRRLFVILTFAGTVLACKRTPAAAEAAPAYKPAQTDYGKVNGAWIYQAGTALKADPGTVLIAADLYLPPPEGGKFDLDDIDLFDADTGENFGSDPYLERLTLNGEFIDTDDPDVAGQREYRGIFVWAVPRSVKRVNFGYWGEMLYVNPVTLGTDPRVLPERKADVVGLDHAGKASADYERYLAVFHVRESFRNYSPRHYTLLDSRAPKGRNLCDCDAWIELDGEGTPLGIPMQQRPYLLANRWFLMEYWCPSGIRPDSINLFGTHTRISSPQPLEVGANAIRAVASAPREKYSSHQPEPRR